MKQFGRIYEVGILLGYNLKSGHLMADADLGPKVMSRGKIHFLPKKIKGADKVAKIFERFQEKAKKA
jgi:heterodisulfide reductase subunit C